MIPALPVRLVGMTYKVGPKGQVVLPKAIRDRHGIEPGDEVEIREAGGEILVRPIRRPVRLRGLLADLPGRGTEALLEERRLEREREDAKVRRLTS